MDLELELELQRFYLIGSDRNRSIRAVRSEYKPTPCQRIAEVNRATGGLTFVAKVFGTAGCIKFFESSYFILVIKLRQIGSICAHASSIKESQLITIPMSQFILI